MGSAIGVVATERRSQHSFVQSGASRVLQSLHQFGGSEVTVSDT